MNPAMHISRSDVEKFSQANAFEPLPLPRNYFPRLSISHRDRDAYVAQARALLDASLARLGDAKERTSQLREWKELGSQGGFRRFAQRVAGGDQRFRVEGTSRTSLNNLMGALFADSTAQVKSRRANLFRDLLDAQTLAVLQPRAVSLDTAAQEEFLALRWQAVSLGAASNAQHWDMVFLEYTGVATDNDGFPVGFHMTTTVERPECGLLKETYGLSRLRGTEVLLLFPARGIAQGGHTDVVLDGVWAEPEMVSSWVVQSHLAVASQSLSKLALLVQDQLLARLPVRDKGDLVPQGDRKTCNVCLSKFGIMSKKSSCRSCGEVVCKACVVTRKAGDAHKFCKKCLIEASSQRSVIESSSMSGYSFDRDRRSSSSGNSASRYTGSSASASGTVLGSSVHMRRFGSETSSSASASAALVPAGYASASTASTPRIQRMGSSNRMLPPSDGVRDVAKYSDSGYGYSMASTASVSSYDSFSESVTDRGGSEFFDVDEDGVLVVTTRRAVGGGGSRAVGAPVPTVQAVEDSIAHQRFILNEMMSQARTYQQQQQQQTRAYRS